jgi:uncharacterized protein
MKTPSLNEVIAPKRRWVSWRVGFSRNPPKSVARGDVLRRLERCHVLATDSAKAYTPTCELERWVVIAVLVLLNGCSTLVPVKDTAIHHLLEPLVPDRALTVITPAIAIKHPSLPSYLDRQQLVTRRKGELVMSKIDLWGEPLDAGIARVLASNLSRLTGSMNIQSVQSSSTLDYTELLELRIAQFESDSTSTLVFQGTWRLQAVSGKESSPHFFRIAMPMKALPVTMADRVTAMNQALERLARDILAAK